jgi:hypothetical protein
VEPLRSRWGLLDLLEELRRNETRRGTARYDQLCRLTGGEDTDILTPNSAERGTVVSLAHDSNELATALTVGPRSGDTAGYREGFHAEDMRRESRQFHATHET